MVKDVVKNMSLTTDEIEAGSEYLSALRRLKFEPEVMCWTYVDSQSFAPDIEADFKDIRKELAIVSSLVDYAGPKALYDLLFQAYDASLLPQQIDPFSVTLYSPLTPGGRLLTKQVTAHLVEEGLAKGRKDDPTLINIVQAAFEMPNLSHLLIVLDGVYVARKSAAGVKSEQKYQSFKDEVLRRAA